MITSITPNPVTIGEVERGVDIPINQWWGIRFGEGDRDAWQGSYERLLDRAFESDIPEMTAADADEEYGIAGVLKFDYPIRPHAAREKRERVIADMQTEQWRQSAKHNAIGWKGITGFGAMVAGQMSSPLDFGLSILPVFGAEKIGVQTAAKVGWRQSLKFGADLPLTAIGQRGGLVSFKAAGIAAKFPLFTESVLNGAASSAVGELATYFDQRAAHEETNYLGNVVVGAVSAGAFHFGIRLLGRALEPAARIFKELTPETHEAAARRALSAAENGEKITPGEDGPLAHAGTDENVISVQSKTDIAEPLDALKIGDQERIMDVDSVLAESKTIEGVRYELFNGEKLKENRAAIRITDIDTGKIVTLKQYQTFDAADAEFRTSVQRAGESVLPQDVGAGAGTPGPVDLQRVEAVREARVQAFIESQDPKLKAERQQRIAQQEAAEAAKETKPTPKGDKWSNALGDLEKEKAQMDADSAELEVQLRKELAEELGDVEAVSDLDVKLNDLKKKALALDKAEKAAIDCLLKGPNA